jgi:hypothetical protein
VPALDEKFGLARATCDILGAQTGGKQHKERSKTLSHSSNSLTFLIEDQNVSRGPQPLLRVN